MTEIVSGRLHVRASGFAYAEDPRWHNGRLYFSDMYGGKMHALDLSGRSRRSSIAATAPRRAWAGCRTATCWSCRCSTAGCCGWILREPSAITPTFPLATHSVNDMVVDRTGRAYVGIARQGRVMFIT